MIRFDPTFLNQYYIEFNLISRFPDATIESLWKKILYHWHSQLELNKGKWVSHMRI